MWHRIKDLWTHNRLLLLTFIAVLGVAGFFGTRSVSNFIYWSDPAHFEQPLAGWMTPRYVGQSYDVPREVIQSAFGVTLDAANRHISLESLAEEKNVTLDALQTSLDAAVTAWRAENPGARP